MTVNAPTWFPTQYANRAMHIYQNKGNRLRPMVTQATRIEGAEKAVFWLAGKSKAVKKTRNQRNVPSNAERKKFEVPLATWTAFDTVEEYDLDRMTVDEKEIVYQSGAMALGRATDIEIYDVMKAAKPAADAGLDFSAGAFSAANALTLCAALQNDKVPWDGQVFCGLPSLQWNQFLANKVVNSADQVKDLPFTKATDTRFWNGVNWFLQVEEDPEDFYRVPAANKQDLMIWHKSALGWGNHTDLRVIPQWDNYEDWWTINMAAKGCATTMQEGKGIKCFTTSSNSAIAIV
ncbi:phage capsid protein [Aquamicrobium sp. NLF2-7]|uniref:phage capsid protein n=1 Tax=Aquamicrobium sp. NLF2-7 TaxID=2918753 RepID=UPI001EFA8041|nr:phage capsid protein [Aquamicrobium sp. NLF2-7]MCG8273119.1 phage capsid protein [Aquamicrobium sp. NLF2-7]